jgi:general secretion pathway protein C
MMTSTTSNSISVKPRGALCKDKDFMNTLSGRQGSGVSKKAPPRQLAVAIVTGRLNDNRRMSARLGSLFIWALAAASAVFWGLKLWAQPLPVPSNATVVQAHQPLQGELARLLGADPVAPPEAKAAAPVPDVRLTLVGVVSPGGSRHAREGLALISVDGKPARTYRVGAAVDGDRVLQSVSLRGATLGPSGGPAQVSLSLPPPVEAARGFPGAQRPPTGLPGLPGAMPHTPPMGMGQPEIAPSVADAPLPGQDRATLR